MIDLHALVAEYGVWGLGLFCFVSGTILPISSEAALALALRNGMMPGIALVSASLGNCLACALNYALGFWFAQKMHTQLQASRFGAKALHWVESLGWWGLAGSWLPFVGDPLTIASGIAKLPFVRFAVIVFGLRILRYAVVIWGMQ